MKFSVLLSQAIDVIGFDQCFMGLHIFTEQLKILFRMPFSGPAGSGGLQKHSYFEKVYDGVIFIAHQPG